MSDQKKWFKVWTSLLIDCDHLSNADVGAWVRLGCRIALVGDSGKVRFEQGWEHLAKFLKCSVEDAQACVKRVHGIIIEEGKTVHDELTVSFKKWYEYQEDSTYKERLKKTRDKRRGEEKRGDDIRGEENSRRATRFPDGFSISDEMKAWASDHRLPDPSIELEAFRDYHTSKGSLFKSWDAAFMTWLRNGKRFAGNGKQPAAPQTSQVPAYHPKPTERRADPAIRDGLRKLVSDLTENMEGKNG